MLPPTAAGGSCRRVWPAKCLIGERFTALRIFCCLVRSMPQEGTAASLVVTVTGPACTENGPRLHGGDELRG